jgi:hypothetical protein
MTGSGCSERTLFSVDTIDAHRMLIFGLSEAYHTEWRNFFTQEAGTIVAVMDHPLESYQVVWQKVY